MASRIVVEQTRSNLRVAYAEGSGKRWQLRSVHAQPLASQVAPVEVLKNLLKQLNIRTGQAVCVIAREQVISRVIKFPTVVPDELTRMVELYGTAQLPYPKEQMVFDHHVLDKREGFSTVTVVACRRDVIDRQLKSVQQAGLSVEGVTLSSWGVLGWYKTAPREVKAAEPVLVVNRDEERTDLVLVGEGRLLFSRSVGQGAGQRLNAEEGFESLAQELERSLAIVRKELPGTEVRSLLLTGIGSLEPLKKLASQRFGIPVSTIEGAQMLSGGVSLEHAQGISPVVVSGLAGSDVRDLLNLNLPELQSLAHHRTQIRDVWLAGTLALGVLAMGSVLVGIQVWRQQRIIREMNGLIAQIEPATRDLQAKSRATGLVGSLLEQRRGLAAIMSEIFGATPGDISLERLAFERARNETVLRGSAGSTQQVLSYIQVLERLEGVTEVRLKYSTRRKTSTGERTDFELVVQQESS